jgi:hypothetical protein
MRPDDSGPDSIVQHNDDGTFTKETLKRALKALKRRLKVTRLDDESRLGHDAMSKGGGSGIVGVRPPTQYPAEVWQELEAKGRVRSDRDGLLEIIDQESNPNKG